MTGTLTLQMTRFVCPTHSTLDAVLHYDANEDNLLVWYWCIGVYSMAEGYWIAPRPTNDSGVRVVF
jgi:hypothetical protein